jgi:valyl-tRNA synthetase
VGHLVAHTRRSPAGWEEDTDLFARTFPMDVRPRPTTSSAPGCSPRWFAATSNTAPCRGQRRPVGLDPRPRPQEDVQVKGNVVVPTDLLEQHGADAVRYWAASARPGTDTAFDEGQMKIGRRLAIKLLNASKFALGLGPAPADGAVTEPLDRAVLAELADLVDDATRAFDAFDYARALQRTEDLFWRFCDDYLELVKVRAYGSGEGDSSEGAVSARVALRESLSTLLRLFAPFLPYVTEEVWSWCRTDAGALPGFEVVSVHRADWPDAASLRARAGQSTAGSKADTEGVLAVASEVLGRIRKAKSDAKVSMRADVDVVVVTDTEARLAALSAASGDLRDAGKVTELVTATLGDGEEPSVTVRLAEVAAAAPDAG